LIGFDICLICAENEFACLSARSNLFSFASILRNQIRIFRVGKFIRSANFW
jgi:hypothetical protein